jgi:hypothetical protein
VRRLREKQKEDSYQLSLRNEMATEMATEINPGLLQAVVAFFTITGVRLGLASRTTH